MPSMPLIVWGGWLLYGLIQAYRLAPMTAAPGTTNQEFLNMQLERVGGHFGFYTFVVVALDAGGCHGLRLAGAPPARSAGCGPLASGDGRRRCRRRVGGLLWSTRSMSTWSRPTSSTSRASSSIARATGSAVSSSIDGRWPHARPKTTTCSSWAAHCWNRPSRRPWKAPPPYRNRLIWAMSLRSRRTSSPRWGARNCCARPRSC